MYELINNSQIFISKSNYFKTSSAEIKQIETGLHKTICITISVMQKQINYFIYNLSYAFIISCN